MNQNQFDQLVKHLDSGLDDSLQAAGQELLEEIMAESPRVRTEAIIAVQDISTARRLSRPGRLRWVVGLAAAVAVVLAIALPSVLFRGDDSGSPVSPEPTVTATTAPVDTGNPYLWVSDPEWNLIRLGESVEKSGFLTFKRKRDGASLSINWDPIAGYEQHVHDQPFGKPSTPTTFLGREAELFASGTGYFEKLVRYDDVFVSFFVRKVTRQEFQDLADGLHGLPAQQWLDGLPASVVRPEESLARVEQYAADIPLPEGFDLTELTSAFPIREAVLREGVLSQVTCGWLDVYRQAYTAGDEPGMAAVDRVLSGRADWALAKELGPDHEVRAAYYLERVAQRDEVDDYRQMLGCD